ncbi:MAG: hypothetical protein IPO51_15750 [Dehalococcoidia bacterium]|nr:hypothetical protein [Dehalococcoidia bacterium]
MAIAKFLNRLVFCMFASDVGLLPTNIVGTIIENSRTTARATAEQFAGLFGAMATGGAFGPFQVRHFNGGLFADAEVIEVDSFSLAEILAADREDWSDVEPSIFGRCSSG